MRDKFQLTNELSIKREQFAQLIKLVKSNNVEKWHVILKEICEVFSLPAIYEWMDAVKIRLDGNADLQPMINHAILDEEVIKASKDGYLDIIHYLIEESIAHYKNWAEYKNKCFLNQNGRYDNYKLWAVYAVKFILYPDGYKQYSDNGTPNVAIYSGYKNLALLFAFSPHIREQYDLYEMFHRTIRYENLLCDGWDKTLDLGVDNLIKNTITALNSSLNKYKKNYCTFFSNSFLPMLK
ncbi:MAG: hypothetical protein H0U57_07715 [Tatlockia sp.]|nr:hypothetical protein [Tatlockia sp.]